MRLILKRNDTESVSIFNEKSSLVYQTFVQILFLSNPDSLSTFSLVLLSQCKVIPLPWLEIVHHSLYLRPLLY